MWATNSCLLAGAEGDDGERQRVAQGLEDIDRGGGEEALACDLLKVREFSTFYVIYHVIVSVSRREKRDWEHIFLRFCILG